MNKIPILSFLFFVVLLVFLLMYSYTKLEVFRYQQTLRTAQATRGEVQRAITGMTEAGNPAVPALAELLKDEMDEERRELILGALLRIDTRPARARARAFLLEHPDDPNLYLEWTGLDSVAMGEDLRYADTADLQFLRFAGMDLSGVQISYDRIAHSTNMADWFMLAEHNGLLMENITEPESAPERLAYASAAIANQSLGISKRQAGLMLVELLDSPSLFIRQGAVTVMVNWKEENCGDYNPEDPSAAAIAAWRDWVNGGE